MALTYKPLHSFFLTSFFLTFCSIRLLEAGITIDLIHRDSPLSPLYDPSITDFDRVRHSFRRSISRLSLLKSTQGFNVPIRYAPGGEYVMRIGIGTPPSQVWAIVDTGSDITWIQCAGCTKCFKQEAPLFDPTKSSTYKIIPCSSNTCKVAVRNTCDAKGCAYNAKYADGSTSNGSLAVDTFSFGSFTSGDPKSFPNIVFGCGFANVGTYKQNVAGIVGLNLGYLSLVQQMDKTFGGKFSYCLTPINSNGTSMFSFGSDADVGLKSSPLTTPMVLKTNAPANNLYYYLTLEAITVEKDRVRFSRLVQEGNIVIDSGTTLSFIPVDFYRRLEAAVVRATNNARRVADPKKDFNLCFNTGGKNFKAPTITANFKGADLELAKEGTFVEVSPGLFCFTFAPTDGLPFLGNVHEINYLVGYDIKGKKVSFKRTICSTLK